MSSPQQKWDRIYSEPADELPSACDLLAENSHLLPASGRALELASGRGGNAMFLARLGLQTEAWDLSAVATDRVQQQARQLGLPLRARQVDLLTAPPARGSCDVLVISHFLERTLFPAIREALLPGGVVFYQTFTVDKPAGHPGPSNPDFLLQPGELLQQFADWQLLVYREEALQGNVRLGWRGLAGLVARKPS